MREDKLNINPKLYRELRSAQKEISKDAEEKKVWGNRIKKALDKSQQPKKERTKRWYSVRKSDIPRAADYWKNKAENLNKRSSS